ncbi:MAG: hypothetical protein NC911_09495, partial [Candidatus Omnitrophica bacterium]|nr:hypothetical protein [Candidatus Omnitrophota bacterium]
LAHTRLVRLIVLKSGSYLPIIPILPLSTPLSGWKFPDRFFNQAVRTLDKDAESPILWQHVVKC